jgi:hypothetical protein
VDQALWQGRYAMVLCHCRKALDGAVRVGGLHTKDFNLVKPLKIDENVPISFFHSVIEEPILMLNHWWSGLGLSDAGAVCCKDRLAWCFQWNFAASG